MELTGIFSKLYDISEWIMKFMMSNIVWMVFNLPVIYLVISLFFVKSVQDAYVLLLAIVILLPFFTFPATSALFAIMRLWIKNDESGRLLPNFWRFYKENYVRSMVGGLFFGIIWFLWIMNVRLATIEFGSALFYMYTILTVFLFTWTMHFFSDTIHFTIPFFSSIKKTLFIAIGFIHFTIPLAGATAFIYYFLYQLHPILLFLFSVPLTAYTFFFGYHHIVKRALSMDSNIVSN
ncbi:YesL family protein [Fredinandcohnia quinoae]|uniref:DUF624 domain-containing protein n=1 Tax=Fredinandcohnia quinoae TaxID=2918902 RepID=A0AAW5E2C4_9BACI|nr:DUF624 domain-containing protein [Fredinandcohnia sp. SECRCQ15]MCH1624126.1 DUF624 domain-containing protein [Fredinandcohnia sp. SECRCQ15]